MGPGDEVNRRGLLGLALGASGGLTALLTGCRAGGAEDELAHVQGGFVGPDVVRGHTWRDGAWATDAQAASGTRRVHTLVAGGGVAGLAAARGLMQSGHDDFALLELEDEAGGNARAGALQGLACPHGAHYLPVPGPDNPDLQALMADLGLLHRDAAGRWLPDERHLCHSPQERLFFNGHWQPGLLPLDGVGPDTLAQYRRFADRVHDAQATARAQRWPFRLPVGAGGLWAPTGQPNLHQALARQTLAAWLDAHDLSDPHLRWHLNYVCHDEYGAGIHAVSAWAGLHYFAARHGFAVPGSEPVGGESAGLFTWPEGNAWVTRRMAQPLGERLHTAQVVLAIEPGKHGVAVDAWDVRQRRRVRWLAQRCIVALPAQVAARLVRSASPPVQAALQATAAQVAVAPWVVTNLHLKGPLDDRGGAEPAWDNVLFGQTVAGATALGYVDAGHQALYRAPHAPRVLTVYRALGVSPHTRPGARAELLAQPWLHWVRRAVQELRAAHPDLPQRLTHASVARHGHAMVVPTPEFMSQIGLRRSVLLNDLLSKTDRLAFAHADWAGYSIFEEAFALGLAAARQVAR